MLHKCANPCCSRLFRKMNEGKLFQLSPHGAGGRRRRSQTLQYFWLCDQCKLVFTLAISETSSVIAIPLTGRDSWEITQQGGGRTAFSSDLNSNVGEIQWSA